MKNLLTENSQPSFKTAPRLAKCHDPGLNLLLIQMR